MLVYLDMCSLQRPLDDKTQPRIAVEAEAVLGVLALCQSGKAQMISSDALEYEAARNPHPLRKAHADEVLPRAAQVIRANDEIAQRARKYIADGLKPLDALHLACAAQVGADYFCTCDDQLIRRARTAHTGLPKVVTPIELIGELRP